MWWASPVPVPEVNRGVMINEEVRFPRAPYQVITDDDAIRNPGWHHIGRLVAGARDCHDGQGMLATQHAVVDFRSAVDLVGEGVAAANFSSKASKHEQPRRSGFNFEDLYKGRQEDTFQKLRGQSGRDILTERGIAVFFASPEAVAYAA